MSEIALIDTPKKREYWVNSDRVQGSKRLKITIVITDEEGKEVPIEPEFTKDTLIFSLKDEKKSIQSLKFFNSSVEIRANKISRLNFERCQVLVHANSIGNLETLKTKAKIKTKPPINPFDELSKD